MIFGHFSFEKVLLLLEVDGFGKPREWIGGIAGERFEVAIDETAIRDVVDILIELIDGKTNRTDWEAVLDKVFLKADALGHGLAKLLFELGSPNVRVLSDERIEKIAEDFDVIGLVA